ncbi:hypothetical protein KUTeg_004740 [Tegillarca granosa]|uniref:ATPase AAA-type core domain-containing protein n=1 Tax=Tegillarca granosa TaxID=220873 RepID=A0ABQ9FHP7_TEGGR|nr:hypothetical protein KUTeg_004740 [Tegillarca granosa]
MFLSRTKEETTESDDIEKILGSSNRDLGPILVYGAPGCGKTILVRSAGSQLQKSKFIHVSCSDLISKWMNKGHRFTGADISVMVRDGLMGPIRRIQNATHFCKDDFLEAVNNTRPSVSEEEIKKFLQFME